MGGLRHSTSTNPAILNPLHFKLTAGLHAPVDAAHWKKTEITGLLNGHREIPLLFPGDTAHAAGKNLAAIGHISSEQINIL